MSTEKQNDVSHGIRLQMEKDGNDLVLTIRYVRNVWEMLEKAFLKLGLERYTTRSLFGRMTAEVYRYTSDDTVSKILTVVRDAMVDVRCYLRVIDDINAPPFQLDTVNMAIFRIVPSCSSDECVTILRLRDGAILFTKPHMKCFTIAMKHYIQVWLNSIITVRWRYEASIEVSP